MNVLEHPSAHIYVLALSSIVLLYLLYYYLFSYYIVRMQGDYDVSKKNLGKSLPPYPNGWYIACKAQELLPATTKPIDLSGHNITLLRSTTGKVFALHAYCSHMGANLGIGGTVVNGQCVQCPFHGWLYDGETGHLVDHDGKPVPTNTLEYNSDFGSDLCTSVQWKQTTEHASQRVYRTKQMNGFIYIWLHSDPAVEPYFQPLQNASWINRFSNRGQTIHDISCHIQDIPENGADIFHFKYIHKYLISKYKIFQVGWTPQWKRGDDPSLHQIFQHRDKTIRAFKQDIYHSIVKNIEHKQYYSFANVDNYLMLPIIGPIFVFNLTIVQMGPGLVNIFLKTKLFEILFCQYIHTQDKYHQRLYHEMFASHWLPYWLSAVMLYAEGLQVYYDMVVWNAKRISYKLYYKDTEADRFIRSWREWFSINYQGCDQQLKKKDDYDW